MNVTRASRTVDVRVTLEPKRPCRIQEARVDASGPGTAPNARPAL